MSSALTACVELTALGPQPSVPCFVAAGHACIGRALDASNGFVGVAARVRPRRGDPLDGWRLPVFYSVGSKGQLEASAVEQELREEAYLHDPVVRAVVRDTGRHRTYHDPDPRKPPRRENTIDLKFWTMLDLVDRLKLVYEVSDQVALHFAFDRHAGAKPFGRHDEQLLEAVIAGLAPWSQRVALLHGFLDGQDALSPRERDVACALLGHTPVKEIASQLGLSEPRARELVRGVYKKLRIGSRAQLASAWAAPSPVVAAPPVAVSRARRR